MGRAFEPLATPAAQVTLYWGQKLQLIEVALQNKLNQDPDAVHAGLIETMQTKMVDYGEGQEIPINVYKFMGEDILPSLSRVWR